MNWKLTDNKNWDSLEQQFRWVQDMNFVMQHHLHHEEGSVAVHTHMVLEALQQQPEYRTLPAQEQEILWAAALLHDVEKRSTSVDEGGGISTAAGAFNPSSRYNRKPSIHQFKIPLNSSLLRSLSFKCLSCSSGSKWRSKEITLILPELNTVSSTIVGR